jgi:DNA-directed RNA polymerase subunit K/omega
MGAPSLLKISEDLMGPLSISIKELEAGVIPITVKRNMPLKKEIDEVK